MLTTDDFFRTSKQRAGKKDASKKKATSHSIDLELQELSQLAKYLNHDPSLAKEKEQEEVEAERQ